MLVTLVAVCLRWVLEPLIGTSAAFITVFPSIMLVAVTLGAGPGLVSALLGIVTVEWYFIGPTGIELDLAFAARAAILLSTSAYVGRVSTRLRAARAKADTQAERFRLQSELMDSADEALIVRELGDVIRFWNQGAATLYGWTAAEAIGRSSSALLRTEGATLAEKDAQLTRTGHWEGELVHTSRDGRRIVVESRQTATHAADGHLMVLEAERDITERKKAEANLRANEERLRFALETSHTGAWDLDLVDHTAYRSIEHDRIFGYAELLPKWTYEMFIEHVLPEDRERVEGNFRRAMDLQSDWSFECRIRRADGQIRWIWAAGRHRADTVGASRRMAGIVQDITERKRAEEALQASEARVRHKLESVLAPEGDLGVLELSDLMDTAVLQRLMDDFYPLVGTPMAIVDLKGRVLVKAGWQDICTRFHRAHADSCRHCLASDVYLSAGLEAGEHRLYKCENNLWDMATPIFVAGQHMGNIFIGQFFFEDETPDRERFRAQARFYGYDETEYLAALDRTPRLRRKTVDHGMAFFLKLSDMIAQLGFSNVKLARLMAERDRLNEQLEQRVRERTAELELSNRELETFCYSVSHDLRTPLRSIDGFSQAALEDYGERLDGTGRDYLNRVRNGCRQMDQLIDDLLRLSRVTRDQMRREPVDLTALAQAAILPLQEREPERAVDIRIAPGLTAVGDARLLHAALFNLLENAWKFTAKTPAAVIEVGAEVGGRRSEVGALTAANGSQPSVLRPPSSPVFFVRDNGVGFDMRYADKLFHAFQRLHTVREFAGTGIGLATVARVIQRHGGRIWTDAAVGRGATFYFTLEAEPE